MEVTGTTGRWSDSQLGSNIRAATWMLERATGRFFAAKTATLKFTTNGATLVTIPGLRTASAITLQGATLVVDESYYLIPDTQQTGVSVGIAFSGFGSRSGGSWLSNPEWFDRGLDSPYYPANRATSLPNDLSIGDTWGYAAGSEPEPALYAVKVLAAFFAERPSALLSGARATPDGGAVDMSEYPIEVQSFIADWRVGPWAYGL
jgi:hypothetical protein